MLPRRRRSTAALQAERARWALANPAEAARQDAHGRAERDLGVWIVADLWNLYAHAADLDRASPDLARIAIAGEAAIRGAILALVAPEWVAFFLSEHWAFPEGLAHRREELDAFVRAHPLEGSTEPP